MNCFKCNDEMGRRQWGCKWYMWFVCGMLVATLFAGFIPCWVQGYVAEGMTQEEIEELVVPENVYGECFVDSMEGAQCDCSSAVVETVGWKREAVACKGLLERCVVVGRQAQENAEELGRLLEQCRSEGWKKPTGVSVCGGERVVSMPEWCNSDMEMECFLKGVEEGVQ